jgi:hypothetical protein
VCNNGKREKKIVDGRFIASAAGSIFRKVVTFCSVLLGGISLAGFISERSALVIVRIFVESPVFVFSGS